MDAIRYRVRPTDAQRTLLELLCARFPFDDRATWSERIAAGRLHVGNLPAAADTPVEPGDVVAYDLSDHRDPPAPTTWRWLHRDEHLLAVDKPAGLVVHRAGPWMRTHLVGLVREALGDGQPLHLLGRLDRETSGAVAFARSAALVRTIGPRPKRYLCLVRGEAPEQLACRAPIGRDGRRYARVVGTGQAASTRFERVDTDGRWSLVRALPETGRTHQIRCHLQHLGLPIVGESIYRTDDGAGLDEERALGAERCLLHAAGMELPHPDGALLSLRAPLPADFARVLERLGIHIPV